MAELSEKHVNWLEEYEDWDSVCPFCRGEGEIEVVTEVEHTCWGNPDCPETDQLIEPAEYKGHLVCPQCAGEIGLEEYTTPEECIHCEGSGHITPFWNTVWNLGYYGYGSVSVEDRKEVLSNTSCAVMWNYQDELWYLCLMGCGMDLTASLAKAMSILGFVWLPESWAYSMALDMDYAAYVAGEKAMPRLKEMMEHTARKMQREARLILEAVQE